MFLSILSLVIKEYGFLIFREFFSRRLFLDYLLDENNCPSFIPTLMIWKAKVPIKIHVFAWTFAHGKLNTNDMLQRQRPQSCLSPYNRV